MADNIERALLGGGLEFSVYAIGDDGFAYVTPVERIRSDGSPLPPPRRFPPDVVADNGRDGLLDFIASRFRMRPGYYRIMAVVVTNRPLEVAGDFPIFSSSLALVRGGMVTLPNILRDKSVRGLQFAVLVYEYSRLGTQSGIVTRRTAPLVSARTHLVRAGVWSANLK